MSGLFTSGRGGLCVHAKVSGCVFQAWRVWRCRDSGGGVYQHALTAWLLLFVLSVVGRVECADERCDDVNLMSAVSPRLVHLMARRILRLWRH